MLHGTNTSHNSEDCTVLKSQAKKMKGMYKAQPNERRSQYKKTQELQAIVASSVARAIKSIKKKGKVNKSTKKPRKSSTDEFNAFETMSISDDSDMSSNSDKEAVSVTQNSDSASETSRVRWRSCSRHMFFNVQLHDFLHDDRTCATLPYWSPY